MHGAAQVLVALTPVLTVALGLLSFALTYYFNIVQSQRSETVREDTEWRAALEKGDSPTKSAVWPAFEMASFFCSPRYQKSARSIASSLLTHAEGKDEFDVVYFQMVAGTITENQNDLIAISRAISSELLTLYADAFPEEHPPNLFEDAKFRAFILQPEKVLTDKKLTQIASAKSWQLESATSGLASFWRHIVKDGKANPLNNADLTKIIFVNNDFSQLDFRTASLDGSAFIGKCTVNKAKVPSSPVVSCDTPPHQPDPPYPNPLCNNEKGQGRIISWLNLRK